MSFTPYPILPAASSTFPSEWKPVYEPYRIDSLLPAPATTTTTTTAFDPSLATAYYPAEQFVDSPGTSAASDSSSRDSLVAYSPTTLAASPPPRSPPPVVPVVVHESKPAVQSRRASSSAASEGGDDESAKIQPFIAKLSFLLSRDEYSDCIHWDAGGHAFVVSHGSDRFKTEVLPKFFSHNNPTSFTRQLNVYNFTRVQLPDLLQKVDPTSTLSVSQVSAWKHPSFSRDASRTKLATMSPRPARPRPGQTGAKKSAARRR